MRSSDYKSSCRTCGEQFIESANYRVKILPGKRIPKSSKRIAHTLKTKSAKELTKFQKYMLRKMTPKNTVEVTCAKCSAVSHIEMTKPKPSLVPKMVSTAITPTSSFSLSGESKSSIRKKRKRKTPNPELNAGLFIPPEFRKSTPSTPYLTTSDQKFGAGATSTGSSSNKTPNPAKRSRIESTKAQNSSISNSGKQTSKPTKSGDSSKKMQAKSKAQEQQRDVSQLKKVLFKSKRSSDKSESASRSFQNFLSPN